MKVFYLTELRDRMINVLSKSLYTKWGYRVIMFSRPIGKLGGGMRKKYVLKNTCLITVVLVYMLWYPKPAPNK